MATSIVDILESGKTVSNPNHVAISEEALEGVKPEVVFAQQGDIYLRKCAIPESKMAYAADHNGQLAPGTSRGSRHIVQLGEHVKIFTLNRSNALDGPVIEAIEAWTITHPEHGWITIPAGQYRVTYQQDLAEVLRRRAD